MKNNPFQPIIDFVNSEEFHKFAAALAAVIDGAVAEKKDHPQVSVEATSGVNNSEIIKQFQYGNILFKTLTGGHSGPREIGKAVDEIADSLTETNERIEELRLLLDDEGGAYELADRLVGCRVFMTDNLAGYDELLASVLSNES